MNISKNAKKINKNTAYEMALQLKQGITLSDNDLDSLLLYFAPSIPKKASNAFQWLAKATSKDDVRQYLLYVYVINGVGYGCDGLRMHRAKIDLADGFYCPKTMLKIEGDITAPDYEKIMQSYDGDNIAAKLGDLSKVIKGKKTYLVNNTPEIYAYESQLIDALNSSDDDATFEYQPMNKLYRLVGSNDYGDFVLMPITM